VVEGLQHMARMGFKLIVITNQAGIGHGHFTEGEMHAFNRHMAELLKSHGVTIEGIYYCPFHPEASLAEYRKDSFLRKPQPGMLLQASSEHKIDLNRSYLIGDKASDTLAAKAAGCTAILVRYAACDQEKDLGGAVPDFIAGDMREAAKFIEMHASSLKSTPQTISSENI